MSSTVFKSGVDIWQGRVRPSAFVMDAIVNRELASEDTWERDPSLQVMRSKNGKGAYREDSVVGLRGCIEAVLAAYKRDTGKALTMNALAESLAAMEPNVTAASVSQTLRFLNEGRILSFDRARRVADGLGIDVLDLVQTLWNATGRRIDEEAARTRAERLRNFHLPVARVSPGSDGVNELAAALTVGSVRLDLHEDFFLPGDMAGREEANKALDAFRCIVRLWHGQRAPNSDERGRVSRALERLASHGVHVLAGRLVKLSPIGDRDDVDGRTMRVLVLRFSENPTPEEVPYPREDEIGMLLADDPVMIDDAKADLAWAGQASLY